MNYIKKLLIDNDALEAAVKATEEHSGNSYVRHCILAQAAKRQFRMDVVHSNWNGVLFSNIDQIGLSSPADTVMTAFDKFNELRRYSPTVAAVQLEEVKRMLPVRVTYTWIKRRTLTQRILDWWNRPAQPALAKQLVD